MSNMLREQRAARIESLEREALAALTRYLEEVGADVADGVDQIYSRAESVEATREELRVAQEALGRVQARQQVMISEMNLARLGADTDQEARLQAEWKNLEEKTAYLRQKIKRCEAFLRAPGNDFSSRGQYLADRVGTRGIFGARRADQFKKKLDRVFQEGRRNILRKAS
jgi:hypothetical protein